METHPGAQLSRSSKFKIKRPPSFERTLAMKRKGKAALYTYITILLLNCIWEMLELIFYKEIQPRIIDGIMVLWYYSLSHLST